MLKCPAAASLDRVERKFYCRSNMWVMVLIDKTEYTNSVVIVMWWPWPHIRSARHHSRRRLQRRHPPSLITPSDIRIPHQASLFQIWYVKPDMASLLYYPPSPSTSHCCCYRSIWKLIVARPQMLLLALCLRLKCKCNMSKHNSKNATWFNEIAIYSSTPELWSTTSFRPKRPHHPWSRALIQYNPW